MKPRDLDKPRELSFLREATEAEMAVPEVATIHTISINTILKEVEEDNITREKEKDITKLMSRGRLQQLSDLSLRESCCEGFHIVSWS